MFFLSFYYSNQTFFSLVAYPWPPYPMRASSSWFVGEALCASVQEAHQDRKPIEACIAVDFLLRNPHFKEIAWLICRCLHLFSCDHFQVTYTSIWSSGTRFMFPSNLCIPNMRIAAAKREAAPPRPKKKAKSQEKVEWVDQGMDQAQRSLGYLGAIFFPVT